MSASLRSGSSRRNPRRESAREAKVRALRDLLSVGPAIERNLKFLGVLTWSSCVRRPSDHP